MLREDVNNLKSRTHKNENILVHNVEKIMNLITDVNMSIEEKAQELEKILTNN